MDKIIQKMRNNPRDWRIDSLEMVATKLNMQVRKSGGSHVVFLHENSSLVVTVPGKRPIKPIYIQQFLALVDDIMKYPFVMRPLSPEEGGGWLITFPDLPGCMSDGETPEEALENGKDAVRCWMEACGEAGIKIPSPGESSAGKLLKPLHGILA